MWIYCICCQVDECRNTAVSSKGCAVWWLRHYFQTRVPLRYTHLLLAVCRCWEGEICKLVGGVCGSCRKHRWHRSAAGYYYSHNQPTRTKTFWLRNVFHIFQSWWLTVCMFIIEVWVELEIPTSKPQLTQIVAVRKVEEIIQWWILMSSKRQGNISCKMCGGLVLHTGNNLSMCLQPLPAVYWMTAR